MIGEMGNGSGYDYDLSAFKTRKGRKKRQITRRSNVFAEIHNYLDISETIEKLARLFLYADFKEELLQLLLENPRKQKNLVAYIQAGYPDLLWKRRGGDGQIKLTKQEKADPDLLNASRIKRIARGSGWPEHEVKELLKNYKNSNEDNGFNIFISLNKSCVT